MVIKLTINKKTGDAYSSNAKPAQNVIYIADREQTKSKHLQIAGRIKAHADTVTGNDIMNDTLQDAVDCILKVHFESEETRNSRNSTPLVHPFRKLHSVISTDDDRDD